jgi:hypothetical protein
MSSTLKTLSTACLVMATAFVKLILCSLTQRPRSRTPQLRDAGMRPSGALQHSRASAGCWDEDGRHWAT